MKAWAKTDEFKEGKFLVVRRDGSVPHWPHFVLGGRDPHAPAALRAYADACGSDPNLDPEYAKSVREIANDFEAYREVHGSGDPDAPPHRKDDPGILEVMRGSHKKVYLIPDKGNIKK